MSQDAIQIRDLSFDYPSQWLGKSKPTLRNIELEVPAGESFGFLGHNGAGKTTTIKCLLGLVRPVVGEVLLFGVPADQPEAREKIGYLPEHPYFYDHLTVYELVSMYASLAGVPRSTRRSAVSTALERLGVASRGKSPLRSLSKGLMQRVGMAQAIVAEPKLLILDEPFSGLDPIGRRDFRGLFQELKREGVTIFISSHILEDVENLCERASIMVQGELKRVLTMSDLSQGYNRSYELILARRPENQGEMTGIISSEELSHGMWRMVFENESSAQRALQMSVDSQIPVELFRKLQGSLEDLFMKTVMES